MKIKRILLLSFAFVMTSCMSVAVKVMGLDKKEAEVVTLTNSDRTVAFIPMKHLGPKEFYADVKYLLDSLHNEGYIAYLESVRMTDSLVKDEADLVHIKLRKITGVYIGKAGYLDTINRRLMGRRFRNRQQLINQPPYSKLGSDSIKDKIIDIPMNELVKEYESRFGQLALNDCDYVLKPEDKYTCGKEPGNQANQIVMHYREQKLATHIMSDKNRKIAVVYGALHKHGLLRELKNIDSTWTYKK